MIKYIDIPGFTNFQEVIMLSHLYQSMEKNKETPMTILVHAYECDTKIFKGYVFSKTKTYENVSLTNDELKAIERAIGKAEQVSFIEVIKDSIAEEAYKDFTEIRKEKVACTD